MRVLVIGDSAIAHAVADKIARSAELYAVMRRDNPGIRRIANSYIMQKKPRIKEIKDFIKKHNISYAVVLSRTFINEAVVNEIEKVTSVIGPSLESARIEWDKVYAKEICKMLNIRTLPYYVASNEKELMGILKEFKNIKIAIKPDYYTMGRGTRFLKDDKEAIAYGKTIMKKGKAIVEPFVNGKNFVILAFTDGKNISISPPVGVLRTYKDLVSHGYASYMTGLNLDFLTREDINYCKEALEKIVRYFNKNGIFIKGSIAAEFLKSNEIYLTGFSSTFNDPASINILQVMRNEISSVFADILNNELHEISFNAITNVCKFFFPVGYPKVKKKVIVNIDERCIWSLGIRYFFQGIEEKNNVFYSTSSRSLALTTRDETIEKAEKAINNASKCLSNLTFVERAFY